MADVDTIGHTENESGPLGSFRVQHEQLAEAKGPCYEDTTKRVGCVSAAGRERDTASQKTAFLAAQHESGARTEQAFLIWAIEALTSATEELPAALPMW